MCIKTACKPQQNTLLFSTNLSNNNIFVLFYHTSEHDTFLKLHFFNIYISDAAQYKNTNAILSSKEVCTIFTIFVLLFFGFVTLQSFQ